MDTIVLNRLGWGLNLTVAKMKIFSHLVNKLLLIIFSLLPLLNFAQKADSTSHNTHKIHVGVIASVGINMAQYNTDTYFNYLLTNTSSTSPVHLGDLYHASGSTMPEKINYSKSSLVPTFGMGIEVYPGRARKITLHHLLNLNYSQFSGKYSYLVNYREDMFYISPMTLHLFAFIHDDNQTQFKQNVLSIGYKLQPTYRFLFLSFGINCSFNWMKVYKQKKTQIDYWQENTAIPNSAYQYDSDYCQNNTASKHQFINFPMQVGVGGFIKIKKIILVPGFYFTPCLKKGYNLYNVSIGVLFNNRK